jgi:putative membrane protein insertion efficiency factor
MNKKLFLAQNVRGRMREMVKAVIVFSIRVYQRSLSLLIGNRCRFYPSCSQYIIEAVELHGCGKGIRLGLMRILRCNPLCEGGFDPVPPRKS